MHLPDDSETGPEEAKTLDRQLSVIDGMLHVDNALREIDGGPTVWASDADWEFKANPPGYYVEWGEDGKMQVFRDGHHLIAEAPYVPDDNDRLSMTFDQARPAACSLTVRVHSDKGDKIGRVVIKANCEARRLMYAEDIGFTSNEETP